MSLKEKKFMYGDEDRVFQLLEDLPNAISMKIFVHFWSDKFIDYQKDLIQDFVADVVEKLGEEESADLDVVKTHFEFALQSLNTKLKAFADKVRDIDFFPLKGFVQIMAEGVLMASMIGDVSVMIFRDEKLYYSLNNSTQSKGKIDLFSDFVEGDIESHDEIVYVGTNISDVLDTHDFQEMEHVLASETGHLANFIQDVLHTRIDRKDFLFVFHYIITWSLAKSHVEHKEYIVNTDSLVYKIKTQFLKNKYQVTVAILSIFILFMLINLLSQVLKSNTNTVVTSNGVTVDVTIDSIKKELLTFQGMDPTGEEKAMKYHDILEKLNVLESQGKRMEDIAQLKKVLQSEYYKWFNISYISSLSKFDDPANGRKASILTFNASEKSSIGEMKGIYMSKNMIIAGSTSALVGAIDDNVRWTLVGYNLPDWEAIKACGLSLLRDGIYCFSPKGSIILVNKAGSQSVTNADADGFSKHIGGIASYGKANLYVFESNLSTIGNTTLATRYRNTLWSQTIYQWGQKYYLAPNMTGASFGSGFASFAVDGSFLTWANGTLYQFRRNPASSFTLNYRELKLMGGDKVANKYSNDVKIISSISSKYVYLFDRQNQTFTVYESRPAKNADQYVSTYGLYYLFSFKFDLGTTSRVVDIEVPDPTGDRPELYILTPDGVSKVQLFEYIDSIKQNNVLKTTTTTQ